MAYLQSGDQRPHILSLRDEPNGAAQPDRGGMQINQRPVETNAPTNGTSAPQQDDNEPLRRSRRKFRDPQRGLPIAGRR